jgi:branched-chain amino acid transport system substrate-binding protein
VRGEILKLKTKTIFGDFAADDRGYQTGYNAVTVQWQDGRSGGLARRGGDGEAEIPDPPW